MLLLAILGPLWIILVIILEWKYGDYLNDLLMEHYVWEDYDF